MGWRGSSRLFCHFLPFFTSQKECVRAVSVCVCVRGRGPCGSSERSGEEAEASLIFSLCRAHCCSQTSGLTLITHIYRQGGEEERSTSIFKLQKNYRLPLIHHLCSLLFSFFYSFSLLFLLLFFIFIPLSSCLAFYPFFDFFSYPWHCIIMKGKKIQESKKGRIRTWPIVSARTGSDFILALKR